MSYFEMVCDGEWSSSPSVTSFPHRTSLSIPARKLQNKLIILACNPQHTLVQPPYPSETPGSLPVEMGKGRLCFSGHTLPFTGCDGASVCELGLKHLSHKETGTGCIQGTQAVMLPHSDAYDSLLSSCRIDGGKVSLFLSRNPRTSYFTCVHETCSHTYQPSITLVQMVRLFGFSESLKCACSNEDEIVKNGLFQND